MTSIPLLDAVALGVLLLALPALSVLQLRMLDGLQIERVPVYVSSAVTLVLLGGACLALGARPGGPGVPWLVPNPIVDLAAWTAGLTAGGVALMFGFRVAARRLRLEESALLRSLLPRTAKERRVFAGLSFAAGVGEELAYRGYAIPLLAVPLGPSAAVAVTACAFGVMHVYQGPLGVVRTAILGALLGWAFVVSGSLWPPMLAHAALDLLVGLVFADRLVSR